ncbi:MAG: hypothetical protein QM535_14975 [Limnohabitans sp.]|nr:hypothetical protein [Limnohabitans sp.]
MQKKLIENNLTDNMKLTESFFLKDLVIKSQNVKNNIVDLEPSKQFTFESISSILNAQLKQVKEEDTTEFIDLKFEKVSRSLYFVQHF